MKLLIYGAGGLGRELFDMIEEEPLLSEAWDEIAFVDDTQEVGSCRDHLRSPLAELPERFSPAETQVAIAVGEPAVRKLLADKAKEAGYGLATIVHPSARINKYATLGEGTVACARATVSSDAHVGNNVWLQPNAFIGHDVTVGDNSSISLNTVVSGHSVIGECVYMGLGACVREELTVGDGAVISMGAMVQKDVRPGYVAMGNPAREIAQSGSVFK